jgi:hypothetical protein
MNLNLRNVLKTYALLRSLTDSESALLDTLRAMNDAERGLLVESLTPAKAATKKATKKPTTTREYDHCLRCGTTKRDSSHKDHASPDYHQFQSSAGKSARAASLAEQIKVASGGVSGGASSVAITLCGASLESSGADCNLPEGHALHVDKGYVDYHEFQPPQRAAAVGTGIQSADTGPLP